MNEVKRYTAYDALMQSEHNGKYVLAADYDALRAGMVALLDQLANGSHLDEVPNHDDDSLREIAHRCTCGESKRLLKHAGRVDAAMSASQAKENV